MKPWRTRYRWLLIFAFLAAVAIAVIGWHRERFTRKQYEQIRFGMTPSDLRSLMGCEPTMSVEGNTEAYGFGFRSAVDAAMDSPQWECVASDQKEYYGQFMPNDLDELWLGDTSAICVKYQEERKAVDPFFVHPHEVLADERCIGKWMCVHVPWWKTLLRRFGFAVGG